MSYENLKIEGLDELAVQKLVFDTHELSTILKGHLFIERILDTLIKKNLKKPEILFKLQLSFSFKVALAISLDILPEKFIRPIKVLNKIRNQYAHNDSYRVTNEELSQLNIDWEIIQEKAFKLAMTKGVEDATSIATLFLCWATMGLLHDHI